MWKMQMENKKKAKEYEQKEFREFYKPHFGPEETEEQIAI